MSADCRSGARAEAADSSERRNTEAYVEVAVGAVRKTRHGEMVVEKQERFARLIGQGVSNSEVCRIVGINRRTGTRWRYGRTILNKAGEPRLSTGDLQNPRSGILGICRWPSGR